MNFVNDLLCFIENLFSQILASINPLLNLLFGLQIDTPDLGCTN